MTVYDTPVKLTKKQKEILLCLIEYHMDNGKPPTFRDVQESFGFKSTNAVSGHIRGLVNKGFVPKGNRTSRITLNGVGWAPNFDDSESGRFLEDLYYGGSP